MRWLHGRTAAVTAELGLGGRLRGGRWATADAATTTARPKSAVAGATITCATKLLLRSLRLRRALNAARSKGSSSKARDKLLRTHVKTGISLRPLLICKARRHRRGLTAPVKLLRLLLRRVNTHLLLRLLKATAERV